MAAFMIALRGYDIAEVDRLLEKGEQAAGSDDAVLRRAVKAELDSAHLRRRLRGYARHQVDRAVRDLTAPSPYRAEGSPLTVSDAPRGPRKPVLSYGVTLVLTSMGMAAFLAAAVIGFYFRAFATGILCLVLALLNTFRVVYLMRIGKKGWDSRVRKGG